MRCYLLRKGHIASVQVLDPGSDEDLIKQGKAIFAAAPADSSFDGFEIWNVGRMVYVHPDDASKAAGESAT